jgi:hypothetical protein
LHSGGSAASITANVEARSADPARRYKWFDTEIEKSRNSNLEQTPT